MASDALFQALAQAEAQPDRWSRDVTQGAQAGQDILGGYIKGKQFKMQMQEYPLEIANKQAALANVQAKIAEQYGPAAASEMMKNIYSKAGVDIPAPSSGSTNYTDEELSKMPGTFSKNELTKRNDYQTMTNNAPFPPEVATLIGNGDVEGVSNYFKQQGRSVPPKAMSDTIAAGRAKSITGKVSYIGNDPNGVPLLMDGNGNITRGTVPNQPQTTGGASPTPILPKTSTMPTSSTRTSGEFAQTVIPHINDMRNLIQKADALGYIGPGAGRIYGQFLAGQVGTTGDPNADAILGNLRATDSLIKTGMMKAHFGSRGGTQMYDNFSKLLNSGKQSAAMMNGSLDAFNSFLKGYSEAGNPYGQQQQTQNNPTGKIKVSKGSESYFVDPQDVAEAQQEGFNPE